MLILVLLCEKWTSEMRRVTIYINALRFATRFYASWRRLISDVHFHINTTKINIQFLKNRDKHPVDCPRGFRQYPSYSPHHLLSQSAMLQENSVQIWRRAKLRTFSPLDDQNTLFVTIEFDSKSTNSSTSFHIAWSTFNYLFVRLNDKLFLFISCWFVAILEIWKL